MTPTCSAAQPAVLVIKRLPRTSEYLFAVNGSGKPIVAMSLRKALHRHGGDAFTVHGLGARQRSTSANGWISFSVAARRMLRLPASAVASISASLASQWPEKPIPTS